MTVSHGDDLPNIPDTALIARVCSGDTNAFRTLMLRYYSELFAFAFRRLGDGDAVDDVLQNVFSRVWLGRAGLDPQVSPKPYLYRAVRNALIDIQRADERTNALFDYESVESDTADAADPAQMLEWTELQAAAERAIAALPKRRREVWILVRDQGLSYAEAAEVLGVSVGTVRTQMGRAFAALRSGIAPFLAMLIALRL